MMGQITKIAVVTAVLASMLPRAEAGEPPAQKPPIRGIVLLHNGEILEGRISHADGGYVVDLPDGQIRLKDADVDLVCASLEEGYRRKRAMLQVGNVHDHLELAQWCLRHDLLGPAAVELADAKVADPNNPMIAALQQRLKMASEPPPRNADSAAPAGPTNDELDRMVRGLPRGAVEAFTQSVQPVLMNHCTGSGCHGLQSDTGMKLIRISAGKSPSRHFTQRNLYSVLHYVDQENPSKSKLLTAAAGPHGTVQNAIFSEREAAQYKRLVELGGPDRRPRNAGGAGHGRARGAGRCGRVFADGAAAGCAAKQSAEGPSLAAVGPRAESRVAQTGAFPFSRRSAGGRAVQSLGLHPSL